MKTKLRLVLYLGIGLIVILIVAGRAFRHAKSDALNTAYSPVVTVSGLVVHPQEVQLTVEESGTVQGNREAIIAAGTGGRVVKWFVNLGDYVKTGDPILKVDDEIFKYEMERAIIAYEKAKLDFDRIEKLYKEKSISETDYENAKLMMKTAEVQAKHSTKMYEEATIRAPFDGTITAKMTEVGQMLERGMPAVQMIDFSRMKVTVNITENNIKDLKVGVDAVVIIPAIDDTLSAKVTAIGSRAITGSRAFPVEITFQGNPKIKSGMFAKVILKNAHLKNAMVLPRISVIPDAGNTVVFISKNSIAEKRVVKVLGYVDENVVVAGINSGDTVITVGNQLLSQGMKVAISINGEKP